MKLWKIYQDQNEGYDTYDSAVVAAETEAEARTMHPGGNKSWAEFYPSWANSPESVGVTLIGEASPNTSAGVICASFNAG